MPGADFQFIYRPDDASLEIADIAPTRKRVAGVLEKFLAAEAFETVRRLRRDPRQKIPSRETTAARRRRLLNETTSRAGT